MALCRSFSEIFNVEKYRELEISDQSKSLKLIFLVSSFFMMFYTGSYTRL